MRLLRHSIERHLQEADFLLEVWADCLEAPDYTLDELGGPEPRLIAQLDGLAVAGAPIVDELLMPALEHDTIDTSLACAATLALFEVGTVDDSAGALEILDATTAEDERWLGVVRGLQLSERDGLDTWIRDHLHRGGSNSRVSGLAMATVVRGLDPGPELAELKARLPHPNPEVHAAWRASRRARLADAPRLLDGRSWSSEGLIAARHHAPLRRRHMLALELQIRNGGSQRVDTRSWTTWQLEQFARTSPIAVTLRGEASASFA
ncbi:hypothetical protein [Enhygromyxa salina]|uniref:hypothetical protein n=1 Tax=Enhygromyxa salina TaxID=215803 RepID=UPI0015E61320|nr:hypothetical protein [Enhygromyxa salina]